MIHGTGESKILGGGGCFVRFSFSMYVACPRLALFSMVLVCLRVVVDVFGGCRWLLNFLRWL